jgi:hypothetical protein
MNKQSLVIDDQPRLSKTAAWLRTARWLPAKIYLGLKDRLAGIHLSIRAKILLTLGIVIVMLGMTNAILMLQVLSFSRRYDAMINNITTANSLNGYIKPAIDTEMWNIVAGKTEFSQKASNTKLSTVLIINYSGCWTMLLRQNPESSWKLSAVR